MSHSWLEQLEKELEKKFEDFLRSNPYQESLLIEQSQKEQFLKLQTNQKKIQATAERLRTELLELSENVREWKDRANRAKAAQAKELARKAEEHVNNLINKGRQLWSELDQLGSQFKRVQKELLEISKQAQNSKGTRQESWEKFDAEEGLNHLRKKNQI